MDDLKEDFDNINSEISSAKQRLDRVINHKMEVHPKVDQPVENEKVGDRVADKIAIFGGSWKFIISFCVVLMVWIFINASVLHKAFDPYPFILLNLVLSCLAAIQAPIIMMSQNRQEKRDRNRSEADYNVNIKAEYEVTLVQKKLDLMMKQQEMLMEQHRLQLEQHHHQLDEIQEIQDEISTEIKEFCQK